MKVKTILKGRCSEVSKVMSIGAILILGLLINAQFLVGMVDIPSEKLPYDGLLGRNHFGLSDGISGSQDFYGYTPFSKHEALEIHTSDRAEFWYMAVSPYYKVYFKGNTVRMCIHDKWIEYELEHVNTVVRDPEGDQLSIEKPKKPEIQESVVDQNVLSVSNIFESVDVSYTVDTSVLTEALVLKEPKGFTRVIQKIQWGGITPEYQEDGSIVFIDENGDKIVQLLPPSMEDAVHNVCEDVHYEIIETESGFELHKVIDENGLQWLKNAVYPVVLDPSMETFEDAWESSGLTPYGQYFKNLKEYVNPANGLLTITQTDLVIPGRGFDITFSRVYETPAIFYGSDPYDYEAPPVDLGKGWQLNFPYVGDKYLHLWGGTIFKIEWSGSTFTNHKGSHFTLVKNGDSTYTLTMASGIIYEFSTSGYPIQIKDLDQNTITFSYTSGDLTSITDTIGRTVSLSYSNDKLWKITYNGAEIEFSYDSNGCLQWMEDFLDRRTGYYYNSGYNNWLLSKIEYPTSGYTMYQYNRYSDDDYYKYHVTNQKVYETNQVRHVACSYTGSFSQITSSETTIKNESDVIKGSHYFCISDGLITQRTAKNASGTPLKKYVYTYNSRNEITQMDVYNDGSNLSYTSYFAYDNWGNIIYAKNAEGHEQFFSYANTSTSGFFIDNAGTIIKKFINGFSNSTVPSSVHTAVIGVAKKQDSTYVKEAYYTYDSEAHVTDIKNSFGTTTTWLTYSGTFNEYTGDTSFLIDLTGHTVVGNGVLKVTGAESDITYNESHSTDCPSGGCSSCNWPNGNWSGNNYSVQYSYCCGDPPDCDIDWLSVGPFTHYPGTLGYQSYSTTPSIGQSSNVFTVKVNWKAYPAQVKYNLDNSAWKNIISNLKDNTAHKTVPISDGTHTLYFNESSYENKFSWWLYVPVDNSSDTYTTSMQYDTYGNVTSMTDAESNTYNFSYSSDYSYAYLTEISATTGTDTITTRASYDYYRGWITSIQEPEGVAGSGYDTLFTYDLLGRVTKKESPLLSGQSERSYIEAVYDDTNRTITIIDQLRHYRMHEYDKLGRLTDINIYTGEYGSGTLYAITLYAYRYDDRIITVTDPGNHTYTYTYDFLGRTTQIQYPDSSTITYSFDDTNRKITFTNERGYDRIFWFDWLSRLIKVEEEYLTNLFAQTVYQYDKIGDLTSFTDAENHTTTYEYASLFGLTKTIYPDSEYEQITYDNVGNIATVTDAEGYKTTYTFDDIYRLTELEFGKVNSQWEYYKQISITNFSSDYQYRITVHKGTGTDDAHNVYLNNHCQNDFDDIRFRASDQVTDLDHYRETYTEGNSAVFWVELPPTDQTLYIYYGNTSASSASNGENTFIFFDDCESGTATDTWTENYADRGDTEYSTEAAKYGNQSLKCKITSTSYWYTVKTPLSETDLIIEFWMKAGATNKKTYLRLNSTAATLRWNDTSDLEYKVGSSYTDTGHDYTTNWQEHRLTCTAGDDHVKWEADDTTVATDAHQQAWTQINNLYLFLGNPNSTNAYNYYDNIKVRKYEATEPSFLFGSETAVGGGYQELATVSYTYDLNGNRIKMEDDAPNTGDYEEYSYDYWNRLTNTTRYIGQDSYAVSYQYDVANRLTKLIYPDNMQILYSYDDLNRTTEIKRYIDGSNDEILLDNVQYNTESLLTQFDYGNDLSTTFSYDSRDRLSTLDVADGGTSYLDLDYTYDNNSNITQLVNGWRDTSSTWHSDTESYSYDGLDRLTSASCTSWSHTYSYDKVGNRTSKDGITYTINTVNEVTALSDGTSFIYDSNGNRIQKTKGTDTWDYTYDYANRLKKLEENSSIIGEYVYDGNGTRIQVTEDSITTTYIYSGLDIIYEKTSIGTAVYVYGPTGRIAKRTTINGETNTFYYHKDHLGSTRLVIDENKNNVSAVAYHPFGEIDTQEGSEEWLFNGQKRDATGLYYCGARYYDPDLGRFITRDPLKDSIENPQSLNSYTYCFNNPLKYIDPFGLGATFSDEEAQEEYEEQSNEEVEDLAPGDKGHPGKYFQYENGYILLNTHIKKKGNVGVAVGTYDTSNQPFGGVDTGIVIFLYDDEGNIEDIKFYSFEDMFDKEGKNFDDLLETLEDMGVDLEDFDDAREALEASCAKKQDQSGLLSFGGGIGGLGLGILSKAGGVLGFIFALGLWGGAEKWDAREDILGDLGDAVKKRIGEDNEKSG